jgi:hypothetical protein
MTKDRVGAGLAAVAAIVGLVLVFSYRDVGAAGADDGPAAPPSMSQVVPAPGGGLPAPGQGQQPAQPRPQQPQGDADGDDG